MIAPPFAILADGAVVPLQNCRACGEMGRADMAHYHVCRPSESECATLRAEVERLGADLALESELVTLHAGGASRAEAECETLHRKLDASDHECEALRAEVARLRSALELLRELRECIPADRRPGSLFRRSGAFLAAQPAAPTCKDCGGQLTVMPDGFGEAFTCAHCDQPAEPARTEAERIAWSPPESYETVLDLVFQRRQDELPDPPYDRAKLIFADLVLKNCMPTVQDPGLTLAFREYRRMRRKEGK